MFLFQEGVWASMKPGGVQWVQVLSPVRPETQLCQDFLSEEARGNESGSAEGYINTKVSVLMQGWGSSFLVNGICDMGYVHPLFQLLLPNFLKDNETGHHPQGQPLSLETEYDAKQGIKYRGAEPCSLTSFSQAPWIPTSHVNSLSSRIGCNTMTQA